MKTNDLIQPALSTVATAPTAVPRGAQSPATDKLDGFSRLAGADVSLEGRDGLTQRYAVFEVDPKTQQLHVMVVDAQGLVVRVIPSGSVSEMMESMARYRT